MNYLSLKSNSPVERAVGTALLLCSALLASVFGPPAEAEEGGSVRVEFRVERHGGTLDRPFQGRLIAKSAQQDGFELVTPVDGEGPIELSLPAALDLDLGLEVEGWWAPPASVTVDVGEEINAELVAWPTSRIRFGGAARRDTTTEPVEAASVTIEPPAAGRDPWFGPSPHFECRPMARVGTFECVVPVDPRGRTDLAFRVSGYSTVYGRDIELPAQRVRPLGRFVFEAGGSIIGWVVKEGGGAFSRHEYRLEIAPEDGTSADLEDSLIRLNEGGFFQVRRVPEGVYRMKLVGPEDEVVDEITRLSVDQEELKAPRALTVRRSPQE